MPASLAAAWTRCWDRYTSIEPQSCQLVTRALGYEVMSFLDILVKSAVTIFKIKPLDRPVRNIALDHV